MHIRYSLRFLAAPTLMLLLGVGSLAEAQTVKTRIGELHFELGVPTKETVTKLYDEMDFQRAVQAYLWGLPIVALEKLKQSIQQDTGAKSGDLAVYEGYRSVSVMLTPNVVTTYIIGIIDLAENGPVVIDYPAGATAGALIDWWDRPITDVGIPGPDQGQGAKFLIVGPGQDPPNAEGYRVFRSRTFNTGFFYRVLETDPAKAKALRTAVRIYPHIRRDRPRPTRLLTPNVDGQLRVQAHPRGLAYWERLSQALRPEPVEDRDRFFAAMLKPLGIEKGKPFQPDERQKKILTEATVVGEAMAKAQTFDKRFEGMRYRTDAAGTTWFHPGMRSIKTWRTPRSSRSEPRSSMRPSACPQARFRGRQGSANPTSPFTATGRATRSTAARRTGCACRQTSRLDSSGRLRSPTSTPVA
jgi:hypothetical protein